MYHHELSPRPADLTYVSELFKALADETRIQLVLQLINRERAVGDLVRTLGLPQSTVSRHLGILRHAEVVATRRDGTSVYYSLADVHLGDLLRQAFAHSEHKHLGLPDHQSETQVASKVSRAREGKAS